VAKTARKGMRARVRSVGVAASSESRWWTEPRWAIDGGSSLAVDTVDLLGVVDGIRKPGGASSSSTRRDSLFSRPCTGAVNESAAAIRDPRGFCVGSNGLCSARGRRARSASGDWRRNYVSTKVQDEKVHSRAPSHPPPCEFRRQRPLKAIIAKSGLHLRSASR
jgi:hypothetical protein